MLSPKITWSATQRVSHWIALLATIATAVLALVLVYPPEWSDPYIRRYTAGIEIHKLLGIVAGVASLSLLLAHKRRPPREGSFAERRAAAAAQWALLILTPAVAALGYVASSFYGGLLHVPLIGALPSPFPYDETSGALLTLTHDWLAYVLIGVVSLHGLAALFHLVNGATHVVASILFGAEKKR